MVWLSERNENESQNTCSFFPLSFLIGFLFPFVSRLLFFSFALPIQLCKQYLNKFVVLAFSLLASIDPFLLQTVPIQLCKQYQCVQLCRFIIIYSFASFFFPFWTCENNYSKILSPNFRIWYTSLIWSKLLISSHYSNRIIRTKEKNHLKFEKVQDFSVF